MTPSDFPAGSWRLRAARALLVALAAALAVAAFSDYRRWSAGRQRMLALLTQGGTAQRAPEVSRDVAREPDPVRAALRAARGLLADELDRGWQAELGAGQLTAARELGLVKLARARDIATEALAHRPASWQAAEVLGATRYLDALRRRLPMSAARRAAWRRPLEAARALGPGQAEPARLLAAATLSEWSRLTATERDEAVGLLREAFRDAMTFDLLATSWLRLSPSRDLAYSVVPAEPRAWGTVKSFYAERGDWGAFALAHERQRGALHDRLADRLTLAAKRLAGGDRRRARWYALEIIEKAPPDLSFVPLLATALEILPPGPLGEVRSQRLSAWLDWSRERCLVGDCPFEPAALVRMSGLARPVDAAGLATAAAMGGDWPTAELHAREEADLGADWAPYHLLRARRQARSGDPDGHRRSLERVHPDWRSRAAFHEAAALTDPDDDGRRRPRRRLWPADAWVEGARLALELYPAARCDGVEVELLGIPAGGSVVEVWWNGASAGTHAVAPGRRLRLTVGADPEMLHRLEIDSFIHPRLRPGRARLRDCRS